MLLLLSVKKKFCETANTCFGGNNDVSDDGNDGNGSDGDEDSGATAITGATIFSTISGLLVAVASAMN